MDSRAQRYASKHADLEASNIMVLLIAAGFVKESDKMTEHEVRLANLLEQDIEASLSRALEEAHVDGCEAAVRALRQAVPQEVKDALAGVSREDD